MSHNLYKLLRDLEAAKIPFTLGRHRSDSVLIALTLVGERVEIDVFEDGHAEISRFKGHEDIEGGIELVSSIIAANIEPAA